MPQEPLTLAPPTLYELFPEAKTLEEKAFKFLETHYECGSLRRTGKALKIDPKTVKSIAEFLDTTEAGYRFKSILAEQTEDFYSAKNLTNLFEGFNREMLRLEQRIQNADKAGDDKLALALTAEKRRFMEKLLGASLACRPVTQGMDKLRKKDDAKTELDQYKDLLDDFDPVDDSVTN